MAVPMDNASELSSRERVQRLYHKNAEVEPQRRRSAQGRVASDPSLWQQKRENLETIILEDHTFSEQHEIEYQLWQLHYKRIEELRARYNAAVAAAAAQNEKGGPARPDQVAKIRSQFKTFLSEATGFYHELMLKIRAKYGLPLGYFSGDSENQTSLTKDGNKPDELKKGVTSCHRCLIYLGDLARYKGLYGDGEAKMRDFAAASSYYMQASSLWPSSGNPHHQLAILASYSGDEFVAIYRYFRSLAVESPFSTARENLVIAFEKNRQSYTQLFGDCKVASVKAVSGRMAGKGRGRAEARIQQKDNKAVKEKTEAPDKLKAFTVKYVRLNGVLFTRTSLETFSNILSSAKGDFLELLSSGPDEECKFGSDAVASGLFVVRLVAILIFTVHNVNRDSDGQSFADAVQRSVLLENAYTAMFEFMGHVLVRCSQLKEPCSSYFLPGVLVFVEWLAFHPVVAANAEAEEKQANARLFFWNHCVSLLNKLLLSGLMNGDEDETCFFNMSRYDEDGAANRLALWEDIELRGFSPLRLAHQILDFSRKYSSGNDVRNKEMQARVQRIIAAGKTLANTVRFGEQGVYFDARLKKFIVGSEPPLSGAEYDLSHSPEISTVNGVGHCVPLANNINSGNHHSVPQLNIDEEDEEEEIVFKPPVVDRKSEGLAPLMTSDEVLSSPHSISGVEFGVSVGTISATHGGRDMQNGFNMGLRAPASLPGGVAEHMQLMSPATSTWLAEGASILNGFNNIRLGDNGHSMNFKPQEYLAVPQPTALPHPFPRPMNFTSVRSPAAQIPESGLWSNPHSIGLPGIGFDNTNLKSMPVLPSAPKKNPVGRPVRHAGPPPGFTPVPKHPDELSRGFTMKDGNPLMDDYSWLDGYQMPSSTQSVGIKTTVNLNDHVYNHVSSSGSMLGITGFPFPGKQASAFHAPLENQNSWQNYQFSYHGNQQELLKNGHQQLVALPEQRQGQSLWERHFLV